MSRIFLTGDTHGEFGRLGYVGFPVSRELTKDDYLIILGDFGAIWDIQQSGKEQRVLNRLNEMPYTVLFIDGNHENHDRLQSDEFPEVDMFDSKVKKISDSVFYLQRGHVYKINNETFFVMGGAYSVDKTSRRAHWSWWPQEEPSCADIQRGLDSLLAYDNKVDYILSHTASNEVIQEFLDENGGIAGRKLIKDSASDFLTEVESVVDYKCNFFGHMHPNLTPWFSKDEKHVCLFKQIIELDQF